MGKFTAYNVTLRGMSVGTHEYEYHLDGKFFSDMENTDIHGADMNVKLTVVYRNDRYALHFDIAGEVTLLCDRCLDDLYYPIETSYDINVEYGSDYSESDDTLIIPASDPSLNVSYMIYDTVALAIPMKHVHPMGKCNRQMSALLRKHRSRPSDEDIELEESLMDEMDNMDEGGAQPSDPRWNALKDLNVDD